MNGLQMSEHACNALCNYDFATHETLWMQYIRKCNQVSYGQTELKILVSVVRFRPRPPNMHRSITSTAVFLFVLFAIDNQRGKLRQKSLKRSGHLLGLIMLDVVARV